MSESDEASMMVKWDLFADVYKCLMPNKKNCEWHAAVSAEKVGPVFHNMILALDYISTGIFNRLL